MAQPTITGSSFAGKAAGFYISAALKEAKSLDYLTLMENIKYKSVIQKMSHGVDAASKGILRNATCDFDSTGKLELTEAVLEPKNLQINLNLCKKNLLESWEALQMRAGAGSPPPASFDDYVISYMGEIIANATENNIWTGDGSTNGEFEGFLTATTGAFPVAATVNTASKVGAFDVSNIIENIQVLTTDMSDHLGNLLSKDDLYIYMNAKSYSLYISAISALAALPYAYMNEDYTPLFEGYKIAVCPGMADNQLVAGEKSNLFFGTDLLSDQTRIQIMDMAQLDGSDNMRLVARYSSGVQVGIGADVCWVS